MSRVASEVNALGTFNCSYIDQNAPGGDRGTTRLASIQYPNGQNTGFSYFDNTGDQRLQRISNLGVSGQILSQFDYGYDSAGQIKQWQQFQNERKICYNLAYDDAAGQLTSARGGNGAPQSPYAKEYSYAYDPAANIVGSQTSVVENIKIGGTKTTGDILTVTVFDTALPSGQKSVNYTVQSADTLTSIALNFATAITLDSDLHAAGINAAPVGTTIKVRSISRNLTTFAVSKSSGATETIQFAIQSNGVTNAIISGAKTTGDNLTLIVKDPALPGGQQSISYAVQSSDTLLTIAAALKNGINANANLSALGVTATSGIQGTFGVVSLKSNSQNITNYASSTSSNATEKISLIMNTNENHLAIVGQSPTVNDTISIQIFDASLPGGTQTVSYKVQTGNSAANVATALVNGINGNANLIAAQITASASGANITLESKSPNKTEYRSYADSTNSSIRTLPVFSSVQTVTIGGTRTTGDILYLDIFHDLTFPVPTVISYVVQSSDTTTSMAAGLATAVNNNATLQARGITAVSNSSVVYITTSRRSCAYLGRTSSGATETITVGPSVGSTRFVCNNVNELVAQIPGGRIPITIHTEPAIELLTVLSSVLAIFSDAPNSTSYSKSQIDQTTIILGPNMAGNTTGKFEGPGGIGSHVFLTIHDVRLPGGQKTLTASGHPRIQNMATQLASTINSDAELRAIGIHARVSTAMTSAWAQKYQGEIETTGGANEIRAGIGAQLISVDGPDFQTNFAYDANGNMTSDGTNTYEWDAENRLIKITYPGTGNNSQLTYDPVGRNIKIVENSGGAPTNNKEFIWSGNANEMDHDVDVAEICEERDASGAVTKRFFDNGQKEGSTDYFYTTDHIGSVRELTDISGAVVAQYSYDPFGGLSVMTESVRSDFGFTGMYAHSRSGHYLALYRVYSNVLARWLSRDPLEEEIGPNLYGYVDNEPISFSDPTGLFPWKPLIDALMKSAKGAAKGAGKGTGKGAGKGTGKSTGKGKEKGADKDKKDDKKDKKRNRECAKKFEECNKLCAFHLTGKRGTSAAGKARYDRCMRQCMGDCGWPCSWIMNQNGVLGAPLNK